MAKTHCVRGHAYTEGNTTRVISQGYEIRICVECRNARAREHYARNAEAERARMKRYRLENIEQHRAKAKVRYHAKIEQHRARMRATYHAKKKVQPA